MRSRSASSASSPGQSAGRGQHGDALLAQPLLGLLARGAARLAQRGHQRKAVAPRRAEVAAAVHQHRHALAGQLQGQQRHQVEQLACAVQRRKQHRAGAGGAGQRRCALPQGRLESPPVRPPIRP
jgi:hypothetical protein